MKVLFGRVTLHEVEVEQESSGDTEETGGPEEDFGDDGPTYRDLLESQGFENGNLPEGAVLMWGNLDGDELQEIDLDSLIEESERVVVVLPPAATEDAGTI